jgi:hypothetical protein
LTHCDPNWCYNRSHIQFIATIDEGYDFHFNCHNHPGSTRKTFRECEKYKNDLVAVYTPQVFNSAMLSRIEMRGISERVSDTATQ